MIDLQKELASLTPEERAAAPRDWRPNSSGMLVKVISPDYLLARIAKRDREGKSEVLSDYHYRMAIKAMTVPGCHRASMSMRARVLTIAAANGFTFEQIVSRNKLTELSIVRQEIMWTLREVYKLSFPQIADYLNRGDHTTIVHGVAMHQKRLDGSAQTAVTPICQATVLELAEQGWSTSAIARRLKVSKPRVAFIRSRAA